MNIAIVGRPNVGKSALFNRIANRRIAIVHGQPGITRDRISAKCKIGGKTFTLWDTGGIVGAVLVWLIYLPHWAVTENPTIKLGVFSTIPAIRRLKIDL